jgi:hypothetical protein
MKNRLIKLLDTMTKLCKIRYGNLNKEVYDYILESEKLIKHVESLKVSPISVYIDIDGKGYYIACHANGAILQGFKNIDQAADFFYAYPELFELSNAAYRCDSEALEALEKLGIAHN